MCVSIHRSSRVSQPWDPNRSIITIPAGLSPERELRAIRTVLAALDVAQPAHGARCWCGATPVLSGRIPNQRYPHEERIARGA